MRDFDFALNFTTHAAAEALRHGADNKTKTLV